MSDAKAIDVSEITFSVFPSGADRARWESLTPAERLAVIERDEEAGFASGVASHASRHEILAEVRSEAKK